MKLNYPKRDNKRIYCEQKIASFITQDHIRSGFEYDFPIISSDEEVSKLIGYKGEYFLKDRMEVEKWYNKKERSMVGIVHFLESCEGPPSTVHGGAIASAFDDVLGSLAWRIGGYARKGIPTAVLTTKYLRPVVMNGSDFVIEARIKQIVKHRIELVAELFCIAPEKKVLATASSVFSVRKPVLADDVLPYDEAMEKFGRFRSVDEQKENIW
eukprot:CAMPEP_0171483388 /NCGR_PEP_ID=MMETSP0946-20130122/8142_1 /TAXON_ID=109269 /ORGANISM="Vaucheria litorea, Strain CCMP2940" /LENGTH=211 /DNA_ID=CAMNT_0012015803 /DNA_START=55 /DNA_END=687 /DNA_ORIENTATION=+